MGEFVYEDLQNMCRLCSSKTSLFSIFDDRLESTENMTKVVEITTGVKISPKDEISHMLCNKCTQLTIRMFKFRTTSMLNDVDVREKAAIRKNVHQSMEELFRTYPNLIVPSSVINRDVSPYVTLENNVRNYLNKSKGELFEMNSSGNLPFKILSIESRSAAADAGLDVNFMENVRNQEYPPPSTAEKRTTNSSSKKENPVKEKTKRENEDLKYRENGDPLFTVKPKYKTLHICDLCNHVLYNIRELKRHKCLHMRCSLCRISFSSMEKTKEHQAVCPLKKMMNNMPTVKIKRCDQIQEIREKYTSAFRKLCIIEISEDEEDLTHDWNSRTKPNAKIMQSNQETCEEPQRVKKHNKSLFLKSSESYCGVETSAKSSTSNINNKDIKELDQTKNPTSDFTDSQKLQQAKCENNTNCFTSDQEHEERSKSRILTSTQRKISRNNISGATDLDKFKKIENSIILSEISTTIPRSKKSLGNITAERQKEGDLENETVNRQQKLNIERRSEKQTYPKKVLCSEQTEKLKISKFTRIESSNREESKKMPSANSEPNPDIEQTTRILPVDRERTLRFVNASEIHKGDREEEKRKGKNFDNSKGVKKKKLNNFFDPENATLVPSNSSLEMNSTTKKIQNQTSEKEPFRPRLKISNEDVPLVNFEEKQNSCAKNLLKRLRKDENNIVKTIQTDDILKTKGNNFSQVVKNSRNYLNFSDIPVNTTHSKVPSIKCTSEFSCRMKEQIKLQTNLMNVSKSNFNKTQNTVSENMQNEVMKLNISWKESQNAIASAKFVQSNEEKQVDEPQKSSGGISENNQTIECNIGKQNVALLNSSIYGNEKQIAGDIPKTSPSCSGNSITAIPSNTALTISRCAMSNMPVRSVNFQPPLRINYLVTKSNISMPIFTPNQLPSNAMKSFTCSAQMPPPNTSSSSQISFHHSIYTLAKTHVISTTGLPLIRQLGPNIIQAQSVTSQIKPTPRAYSPTTSSLSRMGFFRQSLDSKQVPSVKQTPISTKIRIVPSNCIKIASNKTTTHEAKNCYTVELNTNNVRFSATDEQNNHTVTTTPENPKYIRVRNFAELKE